MTSPQSVPLVLDPPYVAVIFTARRSNIADEEYALTAKRMEDLALSQVGFMGLESARGADRVGVTVSYWRDLASARAWKEVAEHKAAQTRGKSAFYEWYRVRIAQVEAEYGHP